MVLILPIFRSRGLRQGTHSIEQTHVSPDEPTVSFSAF